MLLASCAFAAWLATCPLAYYNSSLNEWVAVNKLGYFRARVALLLRHYVSVSHASLLSYISYYVRYHAQSQEKSECEFALPTDLVSKCWF